MASSLHLLANGPRVDMLERALDDVTRYVDHLERCWSRFIPTSDISRINQLGRAGGGRLMVDPSTVTLLAAMLEGHQSTAGRFDPTLLPALIVAGYSASWTGPSHVVDLPDECTDRSGVELYDVEVDESTNTVTVPAGLTLDPGGIGKGLAADLAVGQLLTASAVGAMAEIGGDLALAGMSVDRVGWLVNVEHADPADGLLCSLAISGGGVATSSTRSRRWVVDGVERHHQIDPTTAVPSSTDLDAVTVIAPTGWLAEVHATAALAVGSSGVIAYLAGHGLTGIAIVHDDRSVLTTNDLADVVMSQPAVRTGAR